MKDEMEPTTEAVKHEKTRKSSLEVRKTSAADQKKEKLCNILRISSVMAVIITVGSGTKVIPI